jgi:anti-sigma regulatory factor (Ser/Thr protein kinase)/predicted transcriptional regulator
MTNKEKTLQIIRKRGEITTREISDTLNISRVMSHNILKELVQEGLVLAVGKTNKSKYVDATDKKKIKQALRSINRIHLKLQNKKLNEDEVLNRIEKQTGIFIDVNENIVRIIRFAFTEMLNNAIDHSRSPRIEVDMRNSDTAITFVVRDFGIGIFNNVKNKFRLPGTLDAIGEIMKGKTTTDAEKHSGLGVFFTSKMADVFIIDSFKKKLTINNLLPDIFITDRKPLKGTRVSFSINLNTKRTSKEIFDKFTGPIDDGAEFNKTRITIKLYQYGVDFPSRSEAKRVMTNLENFREIEVDFTGVESIGQAFADEIFRVWQNRHLDINIVATNANENVAFMVERAGGIVGQNKLDI